jgi:hypothetical protein
MSYTIDTSKSTKTMSTGSMLAELVYMSRGESNNLPHDAITTEDILYAVRDLLDNGTCDIDTTLGDSVRIALTK